MTMKCSEAQERLSAFVDDELPAELHRQVEVHVRECDSCAAHVAFSQELSGPVRSLDDPTPPPGLWDAIEDDLRRDSPSLPNGVADAASWWRRPSGAWAIAASVLVLVTAGLWASREFWSDHGHDSMAANFDLYLAKFAVDPEQAHETLVATYGGELIEPEDAQAMFGYQPVAAKGGATGLTVEQVYALDMPCCRCTLSVCRRSDGEVVTVLEHMEPQPIWFGDRSRVECLCDGKPTSIVQVNGKLAASWRHDKRHITVIGANDLEEVTRLVAGFNQSGSG